MQQSPTEPIVDIRYLRSLVGEQQFLDEIQNRVILGDCLQILKHFPSNCIDLIHTSPPYNIDKQYAESLSDSNELSHYKEFLGEAISEIKRVLRPGGSIFWQTGYTQGDSGREWGHTPH